MSDADTIKALQRVVSEQERELLVLRPQVAALTAASNGDGWGFVGPCAHGRDPYTRCDTCAILESWQAAVAAERAACAKVAEAGAVVAEQECAWESAIVLRGVAAAIRARGGQ